MEGEAALSRQLRIHGTRKIRSQVGKKQPQNAQRTWVTPPMQQRLCVVSLLESKGAFERVEEVLVECESVQSLRPDVKRNVLTFFCVYADAGMTQQHMRQVYK